MIGGTRKGRRRLLLQILAVILIGAAAVWMIFSESRLKRPPQLFLTTSGNVDMCLSCHADVKLDPAHDPTVIGCAPCHLGDPLAITEVDAHRGMVVNPGDLRHVEKTCSVEGCHPTDAHKVKNSLMATNRGILGTLLYYWGESKTQDTDLTVEELLASGQTSLALDYYRKLCATCHLWKQKNDMPGLPAFFNEKGGGCSACHFIAPQGVAVRDIRYSGDDEDQPPVKADPDKKKPHPLVKAGIPSDNCVRCHNRSGRIGLSYMGIYESEGYGTPYEKGGMARKQLPGARFYLEIADDIHHAKGMECIDCHTRNEIMGDGTSYSHYEEQLEISCETCHARQPQKTRKGNELTNLEETDEGWLVKGKIDERSHPLKPLREGVCNFSGHKRVGCEACHSTWVPQCYGCHAKRDAGATHLDKLTLKETEGLWEEGRSYIRYEKPMLAMWKDEVVIVTPGCQDVVTLVDKEGKVEGAFNRFTMAAINPHTTQAKGRGCQDCHASAKTLGLGEGTISVEKGKLVFTGLDKGVDTAAGPTVPFDAFVTIDGTPLQHGSRADLRPFNGEELRRILRVGICAGCHEAGDDKVWRKYTQDSVCRREGASADILPQADAATHKEKTP
jgi:hypothetical protein